MKKGSYWFSFLSEKEQKEFRENCDNTQYNFETQTNWENEKFWWFISGAFMFDKTPQGHSYWEEISNRNIQ
jgi:hypothetical protein